MGASEEFFIPKRIACSVLGIPDEYSVPTIGSDSTTTSLVPSESGAETRELALRLNEADTKTLDQLCTASRTASSAAPNLPGKGCAAAEFASRRHEETSTGRKDNLKEQDNESAVVLSVWSSLCTVRCGSDATLTHADVVQAAHACDLLALHTIIEELSPLKRTEMLQHAHSEHGGTLLHMVCGSSGALDDEGVGCIRMLVELGTHPASHTAGIR